MKYLYELFSSYKLKLIFIESKSLQATNKQSNKMASIKVNKASQHSGFRISTETPLYLQNGGEAKLEAKLKEMEVYLNVLNNIPRQILDKTLTTLNPATLNARWVGEVEAEKVNAWWNDKETDRAFYSWILSGNHEVNDMFGNWSTGRLGSRWADTRINNRNCRIAFYSRKHDSSQFPPNMEQVLGKRYDYAMVIDPTL